MSNLGRRLYSQPSPLDPPARVLRKLSPEEESPGGSGIRASVSRRSIVTSRKTSYPYINRAFESVNFNPLTNQLELEREKKQSFKTVTIQSCFRVGIFLLTGAVTGVIGVFMETAIERLGHIKYSTFEEMALKKFDGSFNEFLVFVMYRFVGTIVPVVIGAALVTFIAPFAAGGGVAQCIGYLNGINVPNVLSLKGLVVKTLSTVCTVISGLAGGKEGPMMHLGTIAGGRLPSAFPCLEFKVDRERMNFAAAGFGAGISVAFGAPIGGLLLAMEEGVSFLDIGLMWQIYICCAFGFAVGSVIMSLVNGHAVKLNQSELLSLGFISSEVTDYRFFELLHFAVMAVIGGLSGALLIKIHVYVATFRDRYIKTKTRKMITACLAACIVTFFQMSAIWLLRNCSPLPEKDLQTFKNSNSTCCSTHQLYCQGGERSDMSLMFSITQKDILRLFFGSEVLQMSSLLLFSGIYFILLAITMGLSISAGLFIPQIVLGAAWGRLYGTFVNRLVSDDKWARPAKYAYLGAAAQLSGTVGKTFSILVIFVEASSSISLAFPLMVIVSITRTVCTFFVMPIYETQMYILGLPFLAHRAPPLDCDIPITRDMSRPPLVTLPPSPTVASVIDTLLYNNHNGYPIVDTDKSGGALIGLILRQQLLILLKCRAYKEPPPITTKQMSECYESYMKESRDRLDEKKIIESVDAEDYAVQMDLSTYYNCYPFTVTSDMPMIKVYEFFRSLGMRHLVVITKNYKPVGMVTRKDLAKFHTIERFCKVKVKEMAIK